MACKNSCCQTQTHHEHSHEHSSKHSFIKEITIATISFMFLMSGIFLEHFDVEFLNIYSIKLLWYGIPLILVGLPVFLEAFKLLLQKDFFNELTLMSLAVIGAWIIGAYSEGLGVMVFYTIGEIVQSIAVSKSRNHIKALLDVRPDIAHLVQGDHIETIEPQQVKINDIIECYTGEKIPLDGILLTEKAFFNTVALTGESVPRDIKQSEEVLAGMVVSDKTVRIQVTKIYNDSTLANILKMVEEATENKSPTEQFIRKFARYYTPAVFLLAVLLVTVPFLILGNNYDFHTWFYRSLVFLVISCPCALIISIPLGYFGGIGLSSKNGILFKGSNYLEALAHLKTLVTDKTGTMTHGVFSIQEIYAEDTEQLLVYLASLEKESTHPIAKAIIEYTKKHNINSLKLTDVTDIAGMGIVGYHQNKQLLAGNIKLMNKFNVSIDTNLSNHVDTLVFVACDQKLLGYVIVADAIKEDSIEAVNTLHHLGIKIVMLSGDKQSIVDSVAQKIHIDEAYGELLPDGKAAHVQQILQQKNGVTAFVGDGINDAPVLALSDIGIAMGGLGSDLAIETADMIIQTDEPSKISTAIMISKMTRSVVFQNIFLAIGIKIVVLIMGANGLASMWEAIFADVGVSLMATLNSSLLLSRKIK